MNLNYVPLQIQRQLQGLPRNHDRFRQYLHTIIGPDPTRLELPPLGIMNPMGREHVTALLDVLLALDADAIASRALAEGSVATADTPGDFKALW
jgi:hypothetical protein